ncbi:MAG TPA: hypothetical protein PKK36_05470 [Kiritimatiellia bacterium]|nr:hypothetical protein [Kiritimatiellia bacterium]
MNESRTVENRIVIPIETKVREFQGKLLCALTLAERGYRVILGDQRILMSTLEQYTPCIYVDKSFASTKRLGYTKCKTLGNRLLAWDEEGLVYFDAQTYRDLRLDANCLSMLDAAFAWGPDQAEILKGITPSGLPVIEIGHPRMDLLRPEFRGFYKTPVEKLQSKYGKMLLVNTAFPLANHFHGDMQIQQKQELYPIAQHRPDFFEKWKKVQYAGMVSFKEMIPELCRAFPEYTVVVRPHPSEKRGIWESFTSEINNAVVNADGNVVEWILASECVIHFDCTSGLEAFLLEVPAAVYRRSASPGYEQQLPNSLSYRVQTCDEVLSFVRGVLAGQKSRLLDDPERMALLRRHMVAADGELSCDRFADALDALALTRLPQKASEKIPSLNVAWRWWLKRYRRMNLKHSAYAHQKFSGLSVQEIERVTESMAEALGRFSSVAIHQIDEAVFQITGFKDDVL